jgi:methylated-DNA-protein-cysteine methyltransferase-like protein
MAATTDRRLPEDRPDNRFAQDVYALVAQIPRGRVMTYGQIAAVCGSPRSARIVGQVAHWGPPELPWQRVVNRNGGLAGGYTTGGRNAHRRDLEAEGITVGDDDSVDVAALLWWPPGSGPAQRSLFEAGSHD